MPNTQKYEKLIAFIEVIGFVAFALILKRVLDPLIWRFAGPVSLVTVLVILTGYMRFRGLSWSDMGLRALPGIKAKLMVIPQAFLVFLAFAAVLAPIFLISEALGLTVMTEIPAGVEERWGDIAGSLPHYLLWMGIVWTASTFGEEMFFRGFLITRLQAAFKGLPMTSILAVLLPALLFGYGHMYYQGLRGFIVTGAIALAFGAMFLVFKRNLWPIILLHGIINSIGMTSRYMGWDT
ncbi:MAG: type II CAAX endopeptidase family protein [Robiginitomaculum sp.]|nr:type II CAAX endopeptidase family protein [Robiginitomaculum sp.]MDQ7076594.1 type II CAAX endopeptidase family protein [Robiginitomaculum sp.]